MKILCAIYDCGENVENLWNLRGILMEKILDWNMEKLRRNCGAFVENRKCGTFVWKTNTLENYRLENTETR